MDPNKSPLNQNQQDRLSSIMNTNHNPSSQQSTELGGTQPLQPASPLGSTLGQPATTQSQPQVGTPPQTASPLGVGQQTVSPTSLGATPPTPLEKQPASVLEQTPTAQATYQAPTIGMPTTGLGTATPAQQPELKPSKNKPVKINSGSKMMTILYIVGGIILLVVYTVIWAVVFDLQLPFGIRLPF